MKDILIIFAVLLVLLLIISTLGGSVRYNEKFESSPLNNVVPSFLPDLNGALTTASPLTQAFTVEEEDRPELFEGFDGNDCFASVGQN